MPFWYRAEIGAKDNTGDEFSICRIGEVDPDCLYHDYHDLPKDREHISGYDLARLVDDILFSMREDIPPALQCAKITIDIF